jgi:hypothetical protein
MTASLYSLARATNVSSELPDADGRRDETITTGTTAAGTVNGDGADMTARPDRGGQLDTPTARGAITIRTGDGEEIGHGWGEVRVGRDPTTGRASVVGELREMTWSAGLAPPEPRRSYRIGFHGGPSFDIVLELPFPDASQRRATFRPCSPASVPTGARPSVWPAGFPIGRP